MSFQFDDPLSELVVKFTKREITEDEFIKLRNQIHPISPRKASNKSNIKNHSEIQFNQNCYQCGKSVSNDRANVCQYCKGWFCNAHIERHNHFCIKTTPSSDEGKIYDTIKDKGRVKQDYNSTIYTYDCHFCGNSTTRNGIIYHIGEKWCGNCILPIRSKGKTNNQNRDNSKISYTVCEYCGKRWEKSKIKIHNNKQWCGICPIFSPAEIEYHQHIEYQKKLQDKIKKSDSYEFIKGFKKKYQSYKRNEECFKTLKKLLSTKGYDFDDDILATLIRESDFDIFCDAFSQTKTIDDILKIFLTFEETTQNKKFLKKILGDKHNFRDNIDLLIQNYNSREKVKQEKEDLDKFAAGLLKQEPFIKYLDNTSGHEFEELLGKKLNEEGFSVTVTKGSRDHGADIIISKNNDTFIIQCKRYKKGTNVSNKAVQEIVGALKVYNAKKGVVITNRSYTNPARELALINDVKLIERSHLIEIENGKTFTSLLFS
ncbi:restriction endonuclease [Methanospirillum stamsii]|uniref:Restriction endonuclease type IV Mrr domain-containing protein n=1 Tax=Methanospirillum stamsii TaxID=1277351 RepID=A0A2V2N9E3_9EURY|nr:restriction endonuclease [Methanospirillum stamsii]PWR73108.1 hypothetical protein DLD82_11495 [Methanospirillum stamsii]